MRISLTRPGSTQAADPAREKYPVGFVELSKSISRSALSRTARIFVLFFLLLFLWWILLRCCRVFQETSYLLDLVAEPPPQILMKKLFDTDEARYFPFSRLFRRYVGGLFSNLVIDVGFTIYGLERKTVVSSTLFLPSGHVCKNDLLGVVIDTFLY